MATLREYFDTDFSRVLNAAQQLHWRFGGVEGDCPVRVHFDFDSNATFISCYLPAEACRQGVVDALVDKVEEFLTAAGNNIELRAGLPGEEMRSSVALRFAGRLFLYHEAEIDSRSREGSQTRAVARSVSLHFRGPAFAAARNAVEQPLAFISHDSRDKDLLARPIAVGLTKLMCPVWFDEFSLRVGDRLRESIERGLREARKCILLITPNFIGNTGWSREEFDAIFTRELVEGSDVILPVWSDVTRADVFAFSPVVAIRLAVNWNLGQEEVVRRLKRSIGN